jgi:hypothetical protein
MDEATQALLTQVMGYQANFTAMAIHALVNCLRENGGLRPGQIEQTLRATIDSAGNEKTRLDYSLLQDLLNRLEGSPEPTTH